MSRTPSSMSSEIVRAGAGAGKTTTLVEKVFSVVTDFRKNHGRFPKLVVTTFTKKATQELRERLTVRACEKGDFEMLDFCRSSSQLHMSTIHGVLSSFLRRYGHLMEVDPSFSIMTESGASALRRQILRDCLMTDVKAAEILQQFNIQTLEKLLMSYADQIAANPKASVISLSQLNEELNHDAKKVSHEIRDLCLRGLAESAHPKLVAYLNQLLALTYVLDEEWGQEQFRKAEEILENLPSKPPNTKREWSIELDSEISRVRANIKKWLSKPSTEPVHIEALANLNTNFSQFALRFSNSFRQQKLSTGQFEMSDLENLTIDLLRKHPHIASAFSEDWDFWMIDEFQDTSPLQVDLLSRLIGDRQKFLVGDPQQSIYLFRGARVEVFQDQQNQFEKMGIATLFKMKNYRSRPGLLLFLNDFFQSLGQQFSPMEPREDISEPRESVAFFYNAIGQEDQDSATVEFEGIRQHILYLMKERGASASDICILGRTNKILMDAAKYLKASGIPTHVHSTKGFFSRREIVDAMAILKFLINPHDNLNLHIVLRSPWCRVEDQVIVTHLERGIESHWQQLQLKMQSGNEVIEHLKAWQMDCENLPLSQVWENALILLGFFDHCQLHDKTGRREANLWKLISELAVAERKPGFNILQFVSRTADTEDDESTDSDGDAMTAVEPNFVNLMTIHAAKGLQRKHIILPACGKAPRMSSASGVQFDSENGVWAISGKVQRDEKPETIQSHLAEKMTEEMNRRELAEYERLLYVALTRAEETIFLSWTDDAKPDSWAGLWPRSFHEVGVVRSTNYQHEVIGKREVVAAIEIASQNASTVRNRWSKEIHVATDSISVTELIENTSSVKEMGQSQSSVREKMERMRFGTDIHKLFEKLKWNKNFSWRDLVKNEYQNESDPILRSVDWALGLSDPPLLNLIESGKTEWGFQLLTTRGRLIGQIDLWAQVKDKVWVVDYKTGGAGQLEKAMNQLDIYAYALRRFGYEAEIKRCVIYLKENRFEIRSASSDQAIESRFQFETIK